MSACEWRIASSPSASQHEGALLDGHNVRYWFIISIVPLRTWKLCLITLAAQCCTEAMVSPHRQKVLHHILSNPVTWEGNLTWAQPFAVSHANSFTSDPRAMWPDATMGICMPAMSSEYPQQACHGLCQGCFWTIEIPNGMRMDSMPSPRGGSIPLRLIHCSISCIRGQADVQQNQCINRWHCCLGLCISCSLVTLLCTMLTLLPACREDPIFRVPRLQHLTSSSHLSWMVLTDAQGPC